MRNTEDLYYLSVSAPIVERINISIAKNFRHLRHVILSVLTIFHLHDDTSRTTEKFNYVSIIMNRAESRISEMYHLTLFATIVLRSLPNDRR